MTLTLEQKRILYRHGQVWEVGANYQNTPKVGANLVVDPRKFAYRI